MPKSSALHRFFRVFGLAVCCSLGLSTQAMAMSMVTKQGNAQSTLYSSNITEAEVVAAQRSWADGVLKINKEFAAGGIDKARAAAQTLIDTAYGFQYGPVLFKPTLASPPQSFRLTREGALSYFVGGDKSYPNDVGFGLKPWRTIEFKNAAIELLGDTAIVMCSANATDSSGKVTTVEKTMGFFRDEKGTLRLFLHHSSLPATH